MRPRTKVALLIGWLMATPALRAGVERPSRGHDEPGHKEVLALDRVPTGCRDGAVVVGWSLRAYEVAFGEDQFLTFKGHRAFAMMHLAMHDALNAVVPVYRRYARVKRDPDAHPIAAAAQAAHDVLTSQYPENEAALGAELSAWLDRVPDGEGETRGIALGRRAARAILALREGDGWDLPGTYRYRMVPGAYQTTPPWSTSPSSPPISTSSPASPPSAAPPPSRCPPGTARSIASRGAGTVS